MKTFSERIKHIRSLYTQTQIAEWLGVSVRSLVHYESGERFPNAEKLELLCRNTNISANWLVLGEGPMLLIECQSQDGPIELTTQEPAEIHELRSELKSERSMNRELVAENRQLWKENGDLKAEVATLRAEAQATEHPTEANRRSA